VPLGPVLLDGRHADWSGLRLEAVEKKHQHQALLPDRRAVRPTDTRSGCVEAAAANAKQGCQDLGQRTGTTRMIVRDPRPTADQESHPRERAAKRGIAYGEENM
jgi:hypothetical protein